MTEGVRLAKVLSQAGVSSRRNAEQLIEAGRVEVNGQIVRTQGVKVHPDLDKIIVDGETITQVTALTIALNKPLGVLSTMKAQDERPTLLDVLPTKYHHLHHVGRLDFNTGGLLLLTNDGTLAQHIAHPKHAISKTYLVRIKSVLSRVDVQNLERGVKLSDGWSKFDRVKIIRSTPGDSWLEVQLHSGKNRIVRRTFRALGFPVLDLMRTAIGPIKLGELKPGRIRVLSATEISSLAAVWPLE